MNRHEEFVTLASGHATEELIAAEMYRIHNPRYFGPRRVGIVVVALCVLAFGTGAYFLANRLLFVVILLVLMFGSMARKRIRGEPNLVLVGVGGHEVVLLRASFLSGRWSVMDQIGRWPLSEVAAEPKLDVLAFRLQAPGTEPLVLVPLAITRDASRIKAVLSRDAASDQ